MQVQLSAEIYLKNMKVMKKTLDLIGFRLDKRTKEFKYAKEEIMNYFYGEMQKLFKILEQEKLITPCSCGTNVRKGYKSCVCKGSGYCNIDSKKDK